MKNLKHQNCIIETIFMKKMRMDPGHRWWSRILFLLSEKETVWNRTRITPTQYHCTSTSSSSIVTVDAVTLLSQYFKCLSSNLIYLNSYTHTTITQHNQQYTIQFTAITLKPTLISLTHSHSHQYSFPPQFPSLSNFPSSFKTPQIQSSISFSFSFLNGTIYWIHSRTRFFSI
jgi:hypothetical protein